MPRIFASLLAGSALVLPVMAHAAGPLDAYVPKSGIITGHLMTFSIAPEDQAISRQFRHAVQDNMDWFKKAVTSSKSGQPLPYDRHMGVTEAQYQQLLHMRSDAMAGAMVKVEVKRAASGALSLMPEGEAAAALKDIIFAPNEKDVVTPVGTLSILNEIHQKDAAAPIGVWNGAEWAEVADSDAKPSAKIAFGKREADGSGVLYYQVSSYGDHKEQSIVVFYALD